MHYPSGSETQITLRNGGVWTVWEDNKTEWGSRNHHTYFTPWDIYTIKRRYGIGPNPARAARKVSQNADRVLTHPKQFRRNVAEAAGNGEGVAGEGWNPLWICG